MLTRMTDEDWEMVVQVFRAVRSRRGDKGRNDRRFLEALHYFTLHNITWRALPAEFGNWNSVWMADHKRQVLLCPPRSASSVVAAWAIRPGLPTRRS